MDDCLFFAKENKHIDEVILQLRNQGMTLNKEEDVAGFLGISISKLPNGNIEMMQTGLIDRIVNTLGLDDANSKYTPATILPLPKDSNMRKSQKDYSTMPAWWE